MSENNTASAPKPTLEEVGHRFATWRNQRRARSRIPKGLWQAAVELCAERPIYQVSSALRLSYNDLKWRLLPRVVMVNWVLWSLILDPGAHHRNAWLRWKPQTGRR
jgi:hypothetical protein